MGLEILYPSDIPERRGEGIMGTVIAIVGLVLYVPASLVFVLSEK